MAAEVAISMRLEDALEALSAAAESGTARDLASAAVGVVRLGGAGEGAGSSSTSASTGASTSTASTAARAIGAAYEAKRKFGMRTAAAASALEAVMERGTHDEVEAATSEAERLGATAAVAAAKAAWERRSKRANDRLEAAVAAASALDLGEKATAAADAEMDGAAAAAAALGPEHLRAVQTGRQMVFVARETRRRNKGRVAAAHASPVYSTAEDSPTYDYHMPGAGVALAEGQGGVQQEGWNELRDGTAEAVGESVERGWGRLMWPVPRWPPPSAEENIYIDKWEEELAAKVRQAEDQSMAAAAAAAAARDSAGGGTTARGDEDDDAGESFGGGGGGGSGNGNGGVLTAATVEANTAGGGEGGSLADVTALDLAMEGLGDISALPRMCPKLRTLGVNVNALTSLQGLGGARSLRRLYASHNAIRSLGLSVGGGGGSRGSGSGGGGGGGGSGSGDSKSGGEAALRELRVLVLDGNPLRFLDGLAEAAPRLEALSARSCRLTAAAVAAALFPSPSSTLALSRCSGLGTTLTDLNLSGNNLGSEGKP
jgi:hypothetical protein